MSFRAVIPPLGRHTPEPQPPKPAPPADAGGILLLQRSVGNQAVTEMLTGAQRAYGRLKGMQAAAAADTEAAEIATQIHDALDWLNTASEVQGVMDALSGHGAARRTAIRYAFHQQYGKELDGYLIDQLEGDQRIDALALLWAPNAMGDHVALARAMLSGGVRRGEVLRILAAAPLEGRRRIRQDYAFAFGKLGEGTLAQDIDEHLEEDDARRAKALLDHDLSPAEQLYFALQEDAKKAVATVRETFKRGPAELVALREDWDRTVVAAGWSSYGLRDAIDDEVHGAQMEMVAAWFEAAETFASVGSAQAEPGKFTGEEHARVLAAQKVLAAATTGGWTGAGTDTASMTESMDTIRAAHDARRRRAAGDPALVARLEAEWRAEKERLTAIAASETSGYTKREAELTLHKELSPADRLWLLRRQRDDDAAVKLVTEVWKKGQIDAMTEEAASKQVEVDGRVLRPQYHPSRLILMMSRSRRSRCAALLEPGLDDVARGAARVRTELFEADGGDELDALIDVFTGLDAARRDAIIGAHTEGGTAADFVAMLDEQYEGATRVWDLAEIVDPATNYKDPAERIRVNRMRAVKRHHALHSGRLGSWWREDQRQEDDESGEDLLASEEESLGRLAFIEMHQGNPEAIAQLQAQRGVRDAASLSDSEAALHKERAEAVRSEKQADAEFAATIATLVVEAALTYATAGAYAALIAGAAAAGGMLTKEAMLGVDYELQDYENVMEIGAAVAGAKLSDQLGGVYKAWRGADAAKVARLDALGLGLFEKTGEFAGEEGVKALLDGNLPSEAALADKAVEYAIKVSSKGAGKMAGVTPRYANASAGARLLREHFATSLTAQTTASALTATAKLSKDGTPTDALELFKEIAVNSGKALSSSLSAAMGEARAAAAPVKD